MNRLGIIVLLTVISLLGHAQEKKQLDSLLHALQENVVDTVQMKVNRAIGDYYMNYNNKKAIEYFERSRSISERLGKKLELAGNLYSIGYCYFSDGKYDSSLDHYLQSVQLYEALNDKRRLANAFLSIINVFTANKDFRKANEYFLKANQIILARKDSFQLCTLLGQKAGIFYSQEMYDSSLVYLKKEYEISTAINNLETSISTLGNIGLLLKKQGRTKEALEYCLQALNRIRELPNSNDYYGQIYNNLGSIYQQARLYPQALAAFEESIRYARLLGSAPLIMEDYRNIADLYQETGNFRQEAIHLRKYYSLKDSLFDRETKNQLTELESEYQLNKKNIEVVKLDAAVTKQRNQRNIFIILVLASVTILVILIYSFRKLRFKNKLLEVKNGQIHQQNIQLADLNQVKDRLFGIISHDLRNPLNSLRTYLMMADNEQLPAEKKKAYRQQTYQTVLQTGHMLDNLLAWAKRQIRETGISIVPVDLNDCITDAIQSLQPQAQQKNVSIQYQNEPVMVAGDTEILIIAIRNLLTNATKYSQPGQSIALEILKQDKEVVLSVHDQGQGLTQEQINAILSMSYHSEQGTSGEKGSGLGLFLVRELLEDIHGRLSIRSEVGKGSSFSIHLAAF